MNEPQPRAPTDSSHSKETEAKILLVDALNNGVEQHPEIMPLFALGWTVRRAAPRIVEDGDAKYLVVLERSAERESLPVSEGTISPSQLRRERRQRKRLESAAKHGTVKRPSASRDR